VVLCLNEAPNLPRCLQSLAWCDEALVVDSGSDDGSQEVARRHGFQVLEHRQPGRFLITEQRNWALSQAGLLSDWVLFLDADEAVGPACALAIRQALRKAAAAEATDQPSPDGFELTPRYWFLGRWLRRTQGYPNWHPRLVRRGRMGFEGGVWESFPAGHRVGRIAEPYEHYAFSKGVDDWLERHRRYADWEAERILAYLDGAGDGALGTRRWLRLRRLAARLWPLRPLLRFSQKYLLQGGFLEGWQGLLFSLLMAGYDLITVVKVIERKRLARGLPL
jgi:glycosyltransferase involved in cell wall biosynthesis